MNPEISILRELLSADILCEVDDPHGILKVILCPQVLHTFNNNGLPQHVLKLLCRRRMHYTMELKQERRYYKQYYGTNTIYLEILCTCPNTWR